MTKEHREYNTEDNNKIAERKDRQNLFNIDAEQIILGSIILNNEYLNKISEILSPEHFYEPIHQKIYDYISKLVLRSELIADSVTLKRFFENDESISTVGGISYLSTLLSVATGIFDIVSYAKIIVDFALKRELVLLGENMVNDAYQSDSGDAVNQIETAETALFQLSNKNVTKSGAESIGDSLSGVVQKTALAMKRDTHISGIPTTFIDLDRYLGGMQHSDLIILAGRPSMGKTAFAANICLEAAKKLHEENRNNPEKNNKLGVGFFSLEMSSGQLAARMLAMETGINSNCFRTGEISQESYDKIIEKANELSELLIFTDDTPALSISSVRTRVRRMIRKHNLGLVVVDYLQLLRGTSEHSKRNRVQEISEITQGLKAIAKEFNIPVLALSQLSRAVEQRDNKRPQLSDLRESGSIEQDADVVMFIYRPSYYLERKRPEEGTAEYEKWQFEMSRVINKTEIIIAKHRNGAIGTVNLRYDPNMTKFTDDAGHLESAYNNQV